ncbi:MAG TPA: twin-arginine translocation signal domain-containing protein [Terriglobia bacterium]|nr:twin-arginine translocation signal domain-containing protein [Terriglobia bacterium]
MQKQGFTRRKFLQASALAGVAAASALHAENPLNLVPSEPGKTPSYWCTWGIQNYSMTDVDENSHSMVANNLTEKHLFDDPGWATHYFDKIRKDLYLVFDLGWEVPAGLRFDRERWRLGAQELAVDKFPSCTGRPFERLRKLNDMTRQVGWRGAGIWIPAQAPGDGKDGQMMPQDRLEAYFRERLGWSRQAGIEYWKVDYGARAGNVAFRRMVSRLAHETPPGITVEHARNVAPVNDEESWEKLVAHHTGRFRAWDDGKIFAETAELMGFSDVLRIYDVTAYLSISTTLDRVAQVMVGASRNPSASGLINCEDEPYIAAVLGCATGIMRHPLWQDIPGKAYDPYQVRRRIDETVRAVRWQRIAPAMSVDTTQVNLDQKILLDHWTFQPGQTWATWLIGKPVVQGAAARIARGMDLPEVSLSGELPFVVASRHPNGAVAVATLPRIQTGKGIHLPLAEVSLAIGDAARPVGIFGRYQTLRLRLSRELGQRRVWAQDLAGDKATDVTAEVQKQGASIILEGDLINRVGLAASSPDDVSNPGLVLKIA